MIENQSVLGLDKMEYTGKLIFTRYCKVCHGAEGDGKGFNAFNLQNSFGIQPANFTDSTVIATLTDEAMTIAISKGAKAVGKSQYMPPWGGTLSSEEIDNVVAYIKVLSRLKWNNPDSSGRMSNDE
jgi:mono/diheme cytochrome c family protein